MRPAIRLCPRAACAHLSLHACHNVGVSGECATFTPQYCDTSSFIQLVGACPAFLLTVRCCAVHDSPLTFTFASPEAPIERSQRVLVDYRQYGVSDESYQNGSHMIACPPGHFYHVAHNLKMQPCACVEHHTRLNCQQLSELRQGQEAAKVAALK